MRIKKLTFIDNANQWSIKDLVLLDLTLLVGISGVGKTKILESIYSLKRIANGASIKGIKWEIEFDTLLKDSYIWEGEFENVQNDVSIFAKEINDSEDEHQKKYSIIYEKLFLNGNIISERKNDVIYYDNRPTVKLSSFQSILKILKEDEIAKAANEFRKIVKGDFNTDVRNTLYPRSGVKKLLFEAENISKVLNSQFSISKNKITKSSEDIEKISIFKESEIKLKSTILDNNLPLLPKLVMACKVLPQLFQVIKNQFTDIFPQVEDIKVDFVNTEGLPDIVKESPIIQIKEKNVDGWILQFDLSSGMLKTLLQISMVLLSEPGSVFLVDEFENSLGINCIDILSENLLLQNSSQFIVTSHHPYIINNIDMKYWKIVSRKGGEVQVKDVNDLGLGKSKHEAFKQLINSREYSEGIFI